MFPTTAKIRRQIRYFIGNEPFSIRDFLGFGTRNAVDQAFGRLVKSGEIKRVARGVFIKERAPYPSVLAVARVKAAAFKRTISKHGSAILGALKSVTDDQREILFASSGHTSSFRFGRVVIRFVGMSARKLFLKDEPVGLAIRALWLLGNNAVSRSADAQIKVRLLRSDKESLRKNVDLMPDWMRSYFPGLTT